MKNAVLTTLLTITILGTGIASASAVDFRPLDKIIDDKLIAALTNR